MRELKRGSSREEAQAKELKQRSSSEGAQERAQARELKQGSSSEGAQVRELERGSKKAGRQASPRRAFSQSHALEGLVLTKLSKSLKLREATLKLQLLWPLEVLKRCLFLKYPFFNLTANKQTPTFWQFFGRIFTP